jgi:ubiquinone/menaquinone biosynthesis C-methylase UbiE
MILDPRREEPVVVPAQYAKWRATRLGGITERVETRLVFDLAGPLAGRRVLDVGTGDGTYAIEAARRGADVTGVDSDLAMLGAARARARAGGASVSFQEGRAETLAFADASFHVVLAISVLCFVSDPHAAVKEIARVLAPGGRLVVGELARFSVWAARRRMRAWLGARTWRRAHFWSRRELMRLAVSAGLEPEVVRGAVYFPPVGVIAKALELFDSQLSRWRAPGAAFLVLCACKPQAPS